MRVRLLLIGWLAASLLFSLPARAVDAPVPAAQPAPAPKPAAPATGMPAGDGDPLEFSDVEPPPEEEAGDTAIQDDVEQQETVDEPGPPARPPAASAPSPRHGVPVQSTPGEPFPTSPIIEQQKAFWVRVFSALPTDHGLLHDGRISNPIYEELDLSGMKPKEQRQFIKHRLGEVSAYLRDLADAMEKGTEPDEQARRLKAQLPAGASPDEIREFSRRLRFQRGLSDRFLAGVVRAGAFDGEIRKILGEYDVPEDLVNLPHVESSYNNATRSRAGAAGIWQFTRGTGKLFMTVGYEVDDRLDPLVAARAAAKFLRQNYERLGTWPLAITAYNHGPQSLEKIVGRTGTTDLGYLIEHYDGPLFKFASKNFYGEFLAARHVSSNFGQYFGAVERNPPLAYKRVELPFFLEFERAAQVLGIQRTVLADLNPGLRPPVLTGARYIPKGYRLRIPAKAKPEQFIAAVPAPARMTQQKTLTEIRVARGDTLYSLGRRYNIPWANIAAANNISARSRLLPGQRLILPQRGSAAGSVQVAAVTPNPAAPVVAPAAPAPAAQPDAISAAPAGAAVRGPAPLPILRPEASPVSTDPALAHLAAVASRRYQHLALLSYDAAKQSGRIQAAYGETVGHYADWAQISAQEIRDANDLTSNGLQPGRMVAIPLGHVDPDTFNRQRIAFHQQREESFFSEYAIADTVEVKLNRGQSMWNVAQSHGVPMWLLYRENPSLLQRSPQAGTKVMVPVLRDLPVLEAAKREP